MKMVGADKILVLKCWRKQGFGDGSKYCKLHSTNNPDFIYTNRRSLNIDGIYPNLKRKGWKVVNGELRK